MSFPVARCAILKDPGVPGYTSSVSGSERMLRGGGGCGAVQSQLVQIMCQQD